MYVETLSAESLKTQTIKKAWEEPAFMASLLADPKGAIHQAFGVELPPEFELLAIEETPTRFYLVVPPKPENVNDRTDAVNFVWN